MACSKGACVEVEHVADGVAVRSTKHADLDALLFDHQEWSEFLAAVKRGEFDPQGSEE